MHMAPKTRLLNNVYPPYWARVSCPLCRKAIIVSLLLYAKLRWIAMAVSEYGIVCWPQPRIAWSLLHEESQCCVVSSHCSFITWLNEGNWREAVPFWVPISPRWLVDGALGAYQAGATYIEAPINADHTEGWSWNQGIQTCSCKDPTGRVWIITRVKSLSNRANAVKSLSMSYSTLHARHSLMDKPTAVGCFCQWALIDLGRRVPSNNHS